MVGRFYETLGPSVWQLENQVTIFLLVSEVTTIPIRKLEVQEGRREAKRISKLKSNLIEIPRKAKLFK